MHFQPRHQKRTASLSGVALQHIDRVDAEHFQSRQIVQIFRADKLSIDTDHVQSIQSVSCQICIAKLGCSCLGPGKYRLESITCLQGLACRATKVS